MGFICLLIRIKKKNFIALFGELLLVAVTWASFNELKLGQPLLSKSGTNLNMYPKMGILLA